MKFRLLVINLLALGSFLITGCSTITCIKLERDLRHSILDKKVLSAVTAQDKAALKRLFKEHSNDTCNAADPEDGEAPQIVTLERYEQDQAIAIDTAMQKLQSHWRTL